jgi:hypothetical protein
MEKQITIVLSQSEVELIQDALAIGETHCLKQELGKLMAIDIKILKGKIWSQTKPQVKK